MDLQKPPASKKLIERELLSLVVPAYIFADDSISDVASDCFKGAGSVHCQTFPVPQVFRPVLGPELPGGLDASGLGQGPFGPIPGGPDAAIVFEIGCNTGYVLFWLKEQGAGQCVGIDRSDLDRQQSIRYCRNGIS